MGMKNELDSLLQKEMDRKSFLKHVGIGFVAMTGVAALLKTLNNFGGNNARVGRGYGSSAYGGARSANTANKS